MRQASALRPRDAHVTELLEQWQHEASVQSGYLEKPAEHFRILYEGGTQQAMGDRIARVLEREYWRVGKTLNRYPAGAVTVTPLHEPGISGHHAVALVVGRKL